MSRLLPVVIWVLGAAWTAVQADEIHLVFLQKHCNRCHGSQQQKADRRFDTLPVEINDRDDLEKYQEIVDQLNLESMPPESEPQPQPAERARVVDYMTRQITAARNRLKATGGHSVFRRLNSWEYRQTIGDLLGLNVDVWNPAENFPSEVTVQGLDNNGSGLVTSGVLLEHYLATAEEAIHRATQFGKRPASRKYVQQSPFYFQGKEFSDLPKLFKGLRTGKKLQIN